MTVKTNRGAGRGGMGVGGRRSALGALAIGLVLALGAWGCDNRPTRSVIGRIDNGGSGNTGGAGASKAAFGAIALKDTLLFGTGSPHASGDVWVLAELKSGHSRHKLTESVGGGPFIDVNAAVVVAEPGMASPRIPTAAGSQWTGIVFAVRPSSPNAVTKYRVAAFDGTSGKWVFSNEIVADWQAAANPGVVTISAPASGSSRASPATLQGAPASIDFVSNANGTVSNLVVIVSDRGEHHTMVEEQTAGSHTVGTPGSVTYERGSAPLGSGTWGVAVLGIDKSGWAISTSANPQQGVQHWFRVP